MDKSNLYSTPQRQSLVGIVYLFIVNTSKSIKVLLPLLVLMLVKMEQYTNWQFWGGVVAYAIFQLVWSYWEYKKFTFQYIPNTQEFIIKKGIITISKTVIEKKNIQEILINQPFWHKFLRIYEVEIDSPGTSQKNFKIPAVSNNVAQDLRSLLGERKLDKSVQSVDDTIDNVVEDEHVIKISPLSIIKSAYTSDYIYSIFAFIGILFYIRDKVGDFIFDLDERLEKTQYKEQLLNLSELYFLLAIVALVVVAISINAIRKIIRYYGMKLTFKNHQIEFDYGLLDSKQNILNPNKLQMLVRTQNALQKKIGILNLRMLQIGDDDLQKNSIFIPGCSVEEKDRIVKFLYPRLEEFRERLRPNIRQLIFGIIFKSLAPSILIASILKIYGYNVLFAVIYTTFAGILVVAKYCNSRLYLQKDFLEQKSGLWDIDHKTVEIKDIQAVKISQYFWQRKSNLGSIDVYTAGDSVGINAADFSRIRKWSNYILAQIEQKKWN